MSIPPFVVTGSQTIVSIWVSFSFLCIHHDACCKPLANSLLTLNRDETERCHRSRVLSR